MAKRNSRLPAKPVPEEIEASVWAPSLPSPGATIYGALTCQADGRLRFEPFQRARDGSDWVSVKEAAEIMDIRLLRVYRLVADGVLASKRRARNYGMKVSIGSIQDWLRAGGPVKEGLHTFGAFTDKVAERRVNGWNRLE